MYAIAKTLSEIPDLFNGMDESEIRKEFEFLLDIKLPENKSVIEDLALWFQKEIGQAQKAINDKKADAFYENASSFSAGVVPLLSCLRKIPKLSKSHFSLMLDDAHDLNSYQIKVLNSWIAYRDNSLFSFKVTTTKIGQPSYLTASGGEILEGHDFTVIDMERPYQNKFSSFGKLAREIIQRRLDNISVSKTPKEFFAVNPQFEKDLEKCKNIATSEAQKKFPGGTQKQITDYVYKYTRAIYFHQRSPQSNLPTYSGFETLVHLSTGVIRNLIEPCYLMYDNAISESHLKGKKDRVECIPPSIQDDAIKEKSKKKWEWIRNGLDRSIEGCSGNQGKQLYNLFNNLAILFKKRLDSHLSEPRAITFTISDMEFEHYSEVMELLVIARKVAYYPTDN